MDETKSTGERLLTGYFDRFTAEHLHRYGLAVGMAKDIDVLDIACGEGYGSSLLASVARSVVGVDIDNGVIEHATNKYFAPNLRYLLGSADSIPLESASVDFVVSFETLEHHDHHEEMYTEIKRVLRPDGVLIISTPDKRFFSDLTGHRNAYHVKELYLEEFKTLNQRFFRNIEIYSQKIVFGSLILPHLPEKHPFNILDGDHHHIDAHPSISAPTYHICIASDSEMLNLGFSIFDGERVLNDMETLQATQMQRLAQLEKQVSSLEKSISDINKSVTYRLGNILLWPIKSLFRS